MLSAAPNDFATPIDLSLIERLSDKARSAIEKVESTANSNSDPAFVDLRGMVRVGRGAASERAVFRTSRANLFRDIFAECSESTKFPQKDHFHAAIGAFTLI